MTDMSAAENDDLFPFWVANLPASPPIGRLSLSDAYEQVRDGDRSFMCPADPAAAEAGIEYTSYEYGPGASMLRALSRLAPDAAVRMVSARYRRGNAGVFADRSGAWHGQRVRNVVYLPDWHAKAWSPR